MTRLYARCRGSGRIAEATPGGHRKTVTLLSALRLGGVFAPMTVAEATDADIFSTTWITSSAASCTWERRVGADLLYPPPYSPDFNPIEHEWSKLKQSPRAAKARAVEQLQHAPSQMRSTPSPRTTQGLA